MNNNTITIEIALPNPCYSCNGDCDNCPHWTLSAEEEEKIIEEANEFRLKLNIDTRKNNEVTISI